MCTSILSENTGYNVCTENMYEAFFWDEMNSRYWLGQLKKLSYILSDRRIKTYKIKQVQERWEGKGKVLLPAYNPDSHQQKAQQFADLNMVSSAG